MSMTDETKRILILGGGFGAVSAAVHLEREFARDDRVEITLISDENFLLFTPLLTEVPSSSIEAKHIVSPLRAFFRKVSVMNGEVQSIDLDNRLVLAAHCPLCERRQVAFDYLVVALGATTNFRHIPGVAENALPMKTLSDAMVLRNHLIDLFEHADMQTDPERRSELLTFVVAGGGFAGVETVAELHDFAYTARRYYPNVLPSDVQVVLVHHGSRIMPELSDRLATYALAKLGERGVEVLLNTGVQSAGPRHVALSNGQEIVARTLVWTAGIAPSPVLVKLPCAHNKRGQVIVNEYLEIPQFPGVWAFGDCAEIPNPKTGRPHPATAQHAIREGKLVSQNVAASIRGGSRRPFVYTPIAMLASLGRRTAVAEVCGLRFSGFFAWWLWRTIYLLKLPGLERKIRVALDWTLDLFFRRDIVLLKVFKKEAPSELPVDTERAV